MVFCWIELQLEFGNKSIEVVLARTGGKITRPGAPDIPDGQRVEAVERALAILDAFDRQNPVLTLAALARRTGIYKSTLLRLAGSLQYCGFLVRDVDGRYRPGPAITRLAPLVMAKTANLETGIRLSLARLVTGTGETASFYIRDGDERVCLYRHNSAHAARHHLEEGARLPLAQGAAGRVLTAFTSADPSEQASAYFVSVGERDPAVAAVAVPLFTVDGFFMGALSVSGIRSRFDEARRLAALDWLRQEAERFAAQP